MQSLTSKIVLAVIITAIVVGGAVFLWQNRTQEPTESKNLDYYVNNYKNFPFALPNYKRQNLVRVFSLGLEKCSPDYEMCLPPYEGFVSGITFLSDSKWSDGERHEFYIDLGGEGPPISHGPFRDNISKLLQEASRRENFTKQKSAQQQELTTYIEAKQKALSSMDTVKTRKKIGFPSKKDWCKSHAIFSKNSLTIARHSVMERWETNYMKMLASIVTKNGGDILEIGFGLGIATHFIRQYENVKNHTVIEFHPDVIKNFKKLYSTKIKLLKGFWEEIVPNLPDESFDGILFDTYPLSEKQIHKNHFWFFKEAYRLLRKNGILTYYSDESKSFSKRHIQKLKEAGFRKINFKMCSVNPPKNCMYWDKNKILAPIVMK